MKIIFLNPNINAGYQIVSRLEKEEVGLLFPADAEEAWQTLQLHGLSVDLAVIHREGISDPEAGLKFIHKIKTDPLQQDLPIIITTNEWSDSDCAMHQSSADGANAYLITPFSESKLIEIIEAVLGKSIKENNEPPTAAVSKRGPTSGPVLHEASEIFSRPEGLSTGEMFRLDAPDVEAGPPIESIPQAKPSETKEFTDSRLIMDLSDADIDVTEHRRRTPDLPSETAFRDIGRPTFRSASAPEPTPATDDPQMEQEMPYLFNKGGAQKKTPFPSFDPALLFAEPLGNAVVPGGAAQTPDLETFKKYLLLREQDVAVLSNQLKAAKDQIALNEQSLREEKAKNAELVHLSGEQRQKIENFEKEKSISIESLQVEINDLRFQVKSKTDKARVLDKQAREIAEEMDRLKDRVRADIRKIRVREKELENRLEILKKDSEALIAARENKIIELKRKLDLLEFNMDLLQDQYTREKETSIKLREKLSKAAQVVRVAGGLLDSNKGGQGAGETEEEGSLGKQSEKAQKAS